ncbi:amidase [Pseudovirgaria hyperparasitica]|uniref:Amidase n=1 Tax=Pseudovirgaria hyperparasitica TaxID=470096 RepID=A0A6A6W0F9_9PEZI|nr:amidase [Pseudovirgaria hyperparasitica]KAF2756392.1 amidase [Pseudovirgaria hyperparasitica]
MQDLYKLTAAEVASLLRSNNITVEEYARSLISRVKARDATVKAWAYFDEDLVLDEARKLDQVPQARRGPLHGIAIGVKDVIYTKDMPTQMGSTIYKDDAPKLDAAPVITLRNAGALIFGNPSSFTMLLKLIPAIGKTTTTEFASTTEGPATTNPHDSGRTPGGSSSGSGAAVADLQVPLALGTQTGGSMIRPASFNGVYALKPTWNSVSREGLKVYSLLLDTLGFFARSVEDLEMLADVLEIKDDEPSPETFNIKGAKIAFCKTEIWDQAGRGTQDALARGLELLSLHGAKLTELTLPPEFDDFPKSNKRLLFGEGRTTFLSEYNANGDKLDPFLIGVAENDEKITRKQYVEAIDRIATLRPKFDAIASEYDAVLTPSIPDEAPVGLKSTGSAAFNAMWTALHVPVANVPGFKGSNDMPIGLSLVVSRYHDRHLLQVAKEVGKIFSEEGGWKNTLVT